MGLNPNIAFKYSQFLGLLILITSRTCYIIKGPWSLKWALKVAKKWNIQNIDLHLNQQMNKANSSSWLMRSIDIRNCITKAV